VAIPSADPTHGTRLRVSSTSGRVRVTAEARSDLVVDKGGEAVPADDGFVEVRPRRRSDAVEVRCPAGTAVIVGTISGDVELSGQLGSARVTTVNGSITAAAVGEADMRTVSGKVEIGDCRGGCRVSTKSGRITVGEAGDADVSTVSGKIRIGWMSGAALMRTVSGSITLGSRGGGPITARTVSGSVAVTLPAGVRPALRVTGLGRVRCDCEQGNDVTVDVTTVSGAVDVRPG
jgi:DUF4097 and DUF4098 domain-containing protein YvlB